MSNDLISRETLLNEFDTKCQSMCPACEYHKWNSKLKRHECELINTAPSVEPRIEYGTDGQPYKLSMTNGKEYERTKGEWARHDEWRGGEYIGGFYHVNCPCEDGYYSKWITNFCPNCGQPMMKEDAE